MAWSNLLEVDKPCQCGTVVTMTQGRGWLQQIWCHVLWLAVSSVVQAAAVSWMSSHFCRSLASSPAFVVAVGRSWGRLRRGSQPPRPRPPPAYALGPVWFCLGGHYGAYWRRVRVIIVPFVGQKASELSPRLCGGPALCSVKRAPHIVPRHADSLSSRRKGMPGAKPDFPAKCRSPDRNAMNHPIFAQFVRRGLATIDT